MANKEVNKIKKKIIPILKRNKVVRAGIFGSFARGEEKKKSDIDILVDIRNDKMSLLDMVKLKMLLEKIINRRVDLIEYSMLHPLIKKEALKEEMRII